MIGTTREEMAAFYCIDQEVANADQAAIEGVFASMFQWPPRLLRRNSPDARVQHQRGAAGRPDDRRDVPHRQPAHGRSARRPGTTCLCVPVRLAVAGRIRVLPLHREFRSCSTISSTGPNSPMLKGGKPDETSGLAEAMHGAWIAFARTGKPGSSAAARMAALPARGPHDHALRQLDRSGERHRGAGVAPTVAALSTPLAPRSAP